MRQMTEHRLPHRLPLLVMKFPYRSLEAFVATKVDDTWFGQLAGSEFFPSTCLSPELQFTSGGCVNYFRFVLHEKPEMMKVGTCTRTCK